MKFVVNPITGQLVPVTNQATEVNYDNTSSGLTATQVQDAIDEVQFNVESIPTPLTYKGTWNASTNTPTLANTDTGKSGWLYQVTVAGTVNFGAGPISFDVNDKVVNNGTVWEKWDQTDAVTSVNGQVGAVVLTTSDINEGSNLYFTDERAQDATGAMATNSSKVSLTYNDVANTLTPDIVAGSLVNADISPSANIAAGKIGGLTSGSIPFANGSGNLTQNNTYLKWNDTTHSLMLGDPGSESNGITVNGTNFDSTFKVSDIGGTNVTQTILHKHSTTNEPILVGARSKSNTSSHADVGNGDTVFSVWGAGYAGNDYKVFSAIDFLASPTGTIDQTSAPGQMDFYVGTNGNNDPSIAMTLDSSLGATFNGTITDNALTASRAVVTNGSKTLTSSTATAAEVAFLSGVTSSIQTQLNGKQATGNYITALTGDVTASGPGSAAATLATVNSNVGTFGSASNVAQVTLNGKGLATAASSVAIQIAESQVTNLVSDLAGKEPTITVLPISKGGTNSGTALTGNKAIVSNGTQIIESATTATELGYLSGVTSAIQTQIDGKANTALSNLASTSVNTDILPDTNNTRTLGSSTKRWANTHSVNVLTSAIQDVSGVTMFDTGLSRIRSGGTTRIDFSSADISFNSGRLTSIADPTATTDATTKRYVDNRTSINYATNGNFEGGTTGWSLFNTTLTSGIPTGAISAGATSVTTFNTISSGQLAGNVSLQTASSAAWAAGDGFISGATTIDIKDQAKVMTFKAYYKAVTGSSNINFSGTSSNTYAVYFYDVTNSVWIQPAGVYGITQGSGVGYVTGTFQTSANGTQYRMAILAVNASAGAVTMYWDEFSYGPQTAPVGAVITDWQAYTPTITGFGTVTNVGFYYRQVGANMQVSGRFTAGTVAASTASISLANGRSTLIESSGFNSKQIGTYIRNSSLANNQGGFIITQPNTSNSSVNFGANTFTASGAGNALAAANGSGISSNSDQIAVEFEVPIAGWSSNVQMSSDTTSNVVAAEANTKLTTGTITSTTSNVVFGSVDKDNTGSYNTSTGIFTVPVSGFYQMTATINMGFSTSSVGNYIAASARINGASFIENFVILQNTSVTNMMVNVFGQIYANAGDTLSIGGRSNTTSPVYSTSLGGSSFSITRVSGPSVLAATDTVAMRYNTTSVTLTNNTQATVTFTSKDYDKTNSYSGGVFTVPVSGTYRVTGMLTTQAFASSAANNTFQAIVIKNGSTIAADVNAARVTTSIIHNALVTTSVSCNAGDTLAIQYFHNLGTTPTIDTSGTDNYICIERIGN